MAGVGAVLRAKVVLDGKRSFCYKQLYGCSLFVLSIVAAALAGEQRDRYVQQQ